MAALAIADFVVAALLITIASYVLRRSRMGAAGLFLGVLGLVLVVTELLGLGTASWLLEVSFAAIAICLAIAFQAELRQGFESFASWFTQRRRSGRGHRDVETIIGAVRDMADQRIGALLVFPGRQSIAHCLSGGTRLDARISEPLLLSLFDPTSPGHDGAVIVEGNRLSQFGVHLPLSEDHDALGPGGTRHAAALGLSERCDATAIVVSEERGTVSIASNGVLRPIEPDELVPVLERRLRRGNADTTLDGVPAWRRAGPWVDVLVGAALAALLWSFVAPGVSQAERTVPATVEVMNLPEGYELIEARPEVVDVTVSGPRIRLWSLQEEEARLVIDAGRVANGRRGFRVTPEMFNLPHPIEVVSIHDPWVRLRVRSALGERMSDAAAP